MAWDLLLTYPSSRKIFDWQISSKTTKSAHFLIKLASYGKEIENAARDSWIPFYFHLAEFGFNQAGGVSGQIGVVQKVYLQIKPNLDVELYLPYIYKPKDQPIGRLIGARKMTKHLTYCFVPTPMELQIFHWI